MLQLQACEALTKLDRNTVLSHAMYDYESQATNGFAYCNEPEKEVAWHSMLRLLYDQLSATNLK